MRSHSTKKRLLVALTGLTMQVGRVQRVALGHDMFQVKCCPLKQLVHTAVLAALTRPQGNACSQFAYHENPVKAFGQEGARLLHEGVQVVR